MIPIVIASLLSTLHVEGDVVAAGGDYQAVEFDVPAGTVEFTITRSYDGAAGILDFGVWAPEGFRGWSGGLTAPVTVGTVESSRGYLPGAIAPGRWTLQVGKARLDSQPIHFTADISF